jgi:hypothetical protein
MVSVAPNKANLPQASAPAQGLNSAIEENLTSSNSLNSRVTGERLSTQANRPVEKKLIPISKNSIFANLANFVKLNTSRLMWGVGFVTAGFAIVSNFLFGSQLLSIFFGIPSLMAFFMAHTLGKSVDKGKNNLFYDPFQLIETYLDDPKKLDLESIQALYAIDELKTEMENNPDSKLEILPLLKRLLNISYIKLKQIKEGDDANSAKIRLETEKLIAALEPFFESSEEEPILKESVPINENKKSN